MDIIQQAVELLNVKPPQVLIEAKFVEIDQNDNKALGFDWFLGDTRFDKSSPTNKPSTVNPTGVFPLPTSPITVPAATGSVTNKLVRTNSPALGTISGILTAPQFGVVMRALEQRDPTSVKSLPKVTTPSGKQAVIELPAAAKAEGGSAPGLKLEVLPSVDANGYTISFTVIVTRDGKQLLESRGIVWDAQTVMLGFPGAMGGATNRVPVLGDLPLAGRLLQPPTATNTPGRFLLFLTPTLVDPAGNRIHAPANEPPFAPAAPAQPKPGTPGKK